MVQTTIVPKVERVPKYYTKSTITLICIQVQVVQVCLFSLAWQPKPKHEDILFAFFH